MGWGKISAMLGAIALVLGTWATIVKFDYRPALIIEVRAQDTVLEQKIDGLAQQNIVTKSLVLNDRLFGTEQRIFLKVQQIEEYKSKGVPPPDWLVQDWLALEQAKRGIIEELDALQTAPVSP